MYAQVPAEYLQAATKLFCEKTAMHDAVCSRSDLEKYVFPSGYSDQDDVHRGNYLLPCIILSIYVCIGKTL